MKTLLRTGRLMLSIGLETGHGVFLGWIAVTLTGSLAPLLFAFGLKPLVDGVHLDDDSDVVLGAALCGAAILMLTATPVAGRWVTSRIREHSIMSFQRRILTMSTTAPSLDHFERPEFWNRLQVLKRSSGNLMEGTANILVGPLVIGQLAVTAAVLAGLQPLMLLLPLVSLPAAWLNQKAERLRRAGEDSVAEGRRATQHLFTLASSAQSAKEVRIYGLESELLERHVSLSRDVERKIRSTHFRAMGLSGIGWSVLALAYLLAVATALREAGRGELTPGDVALTLALGTALVAAAGRLSNLAGQLTRAIAAADNYYWLEDQVATTKPPPGPAAAAAVPAKLSRGFELRNVTFRYAGSERPALDGVSLDLRAGQVAALVGENGAGKTTLVKLLGRMYPPADGDILLDGVDIRRFEVEEYRRRISAGFQDFMRWELLAREAVGIGDLPRLHDPVAVRGALGKANGDFVEGLTGGLETQLGRSWEGGVDLSGGEWQKLAIARAMMREDPLLVVFDEPTAALDPQTEHALFEQIAAGMREGAGHGRITLLVSHRFSTVRMADVIVVLERGRVLEMGSHAELMARGGLYAELYGLQAHAYR